MTRRFLFLAAALAFASGGAVAQEVKLQTSYGDITLALDAARAPQTVANFLRYAREGHFDGTVFYRVVPGFVIQAGSYDAGGDARSTHDPIALESGNGLANMRGAVAMARSSSPKSATAEFFIDLSDNSNLDAQPGDASGTTGYAVFGKVVEGMDIVDRISTVQTGGNKGPFPPDASPLVPVVIKKVTVTGAPPPPH